MLADTGARFRVAFGASDGVGHVASRHTDSTVKARDAATGFARHAPFGETIPLHASASSQSQSNTAEHEVMGSDVTKQFAASRTCDLLNATRCRALTPSHEREYDGVERQAKCDNDDLDDVSEYDHGTSESPIGCVR